METLALVKESLRIVWSQKKLWLFGFFVAGVGGGGGGGGGGSHETGSGELPSWLFAALAGASLLALLGLVMHLVSEAALIEGVRRARGGLAFELSDGFRVGRRHLFRLLGVKSTLVLGGLAAAALVALPVGAVLLSGGPAWAAAIGGAGVALLTLPLLLTLWLVVTLAERFVVLDGHGVLDALREGRRLLASRLRESLELLVAWACGSAIIGLVALPVGVVAALCGLAAYAAGGLVPGVVAAVAIAAPAMALLVGAVGTYRSSLWTLGFLSARAAA